MTSCNVIGSQVNSHVDIWLFKNNYNIHHQSYLQCGTFCCSPSDQPARLTQRNQLNLKELDSVDSSKPQWSLHVLLTRPLKAYFVAQCAQSIRWVFFSHKENYLKDESNRYGLFTARHAHYTFYFTADSDIPVILWSGRSKLDNHTLSTIFLRFVLKRTVFQNILNHTKRKKLKT